MNDMRINRYFFVIMEYIEGVSLGHQIDDNRKVYTEYEIGEIMMQIFKAVQYIHNNDIIHKNITPENIMIDEARSVTLVDFGLSRLTKVGCDVNKNKDSTQFIAPEFFRGKYDKSIDIWSLGYLIYYMILGKMPITGDRIAGAFKKVPHKALTFRNAIWKEFSSEVRSLIRHTIVAEAHCRLTINQLIKHKWFNEINREVSRKTTVLTIGPDVVEKFRTNKFASRLQQIL